METLPDKPSKRPEVHQITFAGGTLQVLRYDGHGWLVVRPACDTLGIDEEAQRKRLDRSPWAATSVMEATGADGKRYQMYCLRSDRVPMWLATLETSRVKDPVLRRPIEIWQCEAADVLDRWMRGEPLRRAGQLGADHSLSADAVQAMVAQKLSVWLSDAEVATLLGLPLQVFSIELRHFPALRRLQFRGSWPAYEVYELYKALTCPAPGYYAPAFAWIDALEALQTIGEQKAQPLFTLSDVFEEAQSRSAVGRRLLGALRACLPRAEDRLPESHIHMLFRDQVGRVVNGLVLDSIGDCPNRAPTLFAQKLAPTVGSRPHPETCLSVTAIDWSGQS